MSNAKVVYHYCSMDSFTNIMKTSTIRMGDPCYMNDSAEVVWIISVLHELIRRSHPDISSYWEIINKNLQQMINKMELPYVASFSKRGDVLSQWRSYADNGRGVAIGFDIERLISIDERKIIHRDVLYNKDEQIRQLDQNTEKFPWQEFAQAVKANDVDEIRTKTRRLLSLFMEDAMFFKNPAFEEEQEYRLICPPPPIETLKFRNTANMILPYTEICFEERKQSVIKELILGPKSMANNRNLMLFLKKIEYNSWIKNQNSEWTNEDVGWVRHIKESNATYR